MSARPNIGATFSVTKHPEIGVEIPGDGQPINVMFTIGANRHTFPVSPIGDDGVFYAPVSGFYHCEGWCEIEDIDPATVACDVRFQAPSFPGYPGYPSVNQVHVGPAVRFEPHTSAIAWVSHKIWLPADGPCPFMPMQNSGSARNLRAGSDFNRLSYTFLG